MQQVNLTRVPACTVDTASPALARMVGLVSRARPLAALVAMFHHVQTMRLRAVLPHRNTPGLDNWIRARTRRGSFHSGRGGKGCVQVLAGGRSRSKCGRSVPARPAAPPGLGSGSGQRHEPGRSCPVCGLPDPSDQLRDTVARVVTLGQRAHALFRRADPELPCSVVYLCLSFLTRRLIAEYDSGISGFCGQTNLPGVSQSTQQLSYIATRRQSVISQLRC